MQVIVNSTQQSKDKDKQQELEAEVREERYQKNLIQLFERIAPMNQNRVPQSIENTNESALSLSNLTLESNQIIAITPHAKMQVPKRNNEYLVSIATDDIEVAPKRKRINEKRDSSGFTALTTESGSQSEEQHDPKNGEESKQNHKHQTVPSRQNH